MLSGLSLIMAIGAQNAFVLRQGLRGEHVLAVCLTCAISDAILILLGVTSFGQIAHWLPWLAPAMRYAGAAFLIWYGTKSMRAALQSTEALIVGTERKAGGLAKTLTACLAITWLNPHVYLDTVVLLGTISTRLPVRRDRSQQVRCLGRSCSSFLLVMARHGCARSSPSRLPGGSWKRASRSSCGPLQQNWCWVTDE